MTIGHVFAFDEVPQLYEHQLSPDTFGGIVFRID